MGGSGEIENEIDNLDNLDNLVQAQHQLQSRRVAGPRAASASAAVSTHSRGPPYPRAARTVSLTHLLACHAI